MKPTSKPMTPRSIMNQKKAVESRGGTKARTPGTDENRRPVGSTTPGTPTSQFVWKGHTSRRDGVTPLGISGKLNRRPPGTPSTPTRPATGKSQNTPNRSDRTVLFEFEDNLLITPCQNEGGVSICHTSTVQMEPTPIKTVAGSGAFNRSRSASSLLRTRKGVGQMRMRRSVSEARLPSENTDATSDDEDGELARIAVGVRVRPLQAREYGNSITVDGNTVKVASDISSVHSFVLDHVFCSNTTQEEVYNTMVKPLLNSAFQGYNACLFAYGQTGSGKTYSMMGVETEVDCVSNSTGIIPRFCQELIERVSNLNNDSGGDSIHTSTTVEVSYLEVYNEKIRDLLIPPPSQHLRVREHPVYGPYVADLSKHSVNSLNDIQHWISEGNKQRAIAATEMNEKSSRSHSLFTVVLTQTVIQSDEGEGWTHENTRRSQINMVDLAGSERIAHSSVSSDRLREGVSINRSLMTLGKVISALVDKRSFVPYRESVLTWLLKESLGGNSRTAMLATVSPCSSHQDETMATLRYATQARSILNTVRVNESPQNKIIRELRAEIERLKVCVESEQSHSSTNITSPLPDKTKQEVLVLKSEINSMQQLFEELKGKLSESEKAQVAMEEREARLIEEAANKEQLQLAENKKLKEEYDDLKKKFMEFTVEHEKFLVMCSEKDEAVESFKRRAQTAQNEKQVLQDKLSTSEEEVKRLSEAVEELMRQKSAWDVKLQEMENSVLEWKSDIESRKKNEEDLRSRAEVAEREVRQLKECIAANEQQAAEQLGKTETIEKQVETWKNKISQIRSDSEKLMETMEEERSQKDYWRNEFDKCNNRLESAVDRLTDLEEELQTCRRRLEEKEKEVDEWVKKREDMERQLAETSNELVDVKESLRTISVQVEAASVSKISVSVQTSVMPCIETKADVPELADISDCVSSDQKKEYVRLKKKILEKKKKLESLNAKLIKFESDTSSCDKSKQIMTPNLDAFNRVKQLEETVSKQQSEIEDMTSELDLLRELETRYKNKLDQSLQDSEDAWSKKYNQVCEKLEVANNELTELRKQLKDSQDQVKDLIDRLSRSNLDRQILTGESNSEPRRDTAYLERKCSDLQLKLDQKNNLILELERIGNRAKEEVVVNQTYATEVKKQYDLLECNLKETKKTIEDNNMRIEELETQVRILQDELNSVMKVSGETEAKLSESTEKRINLEKDLKERDQQLIELHSKLADSHKMLQEQILIKFDTLKSIQDRDSIRKEELHSNDVVAVENITLKNELESTKEQLSRKKKRLEKMKSNIDKLEDLLITTMRQSVERKNYLLIKAEHAKLFDCMMEHSYLFHWEYLLRKARSYAHKYHIPYEFERHDETTAVVKHLLYNAKSYWFRIDFKFWFENIEKNDRWSRELDEKLPWEVDFGNYYNIPNEKPGAQCPLEETACEDIEPYCCKPGLICPGVWKRTIVHRHLSGLQDDARCLLIYFKSSKNQEVIELLQVMNNLVEQINDKLSTKT